MSPESIVRAAGRDGSSVPALIDSRVDSSTCVIGWSIFLLTIDFGLRSLLPCRGAIAHLTDFCYQPEHGRLAPLRIRVNAITHPEPSGLLVLERTRHQVDADCPVVGCRNRTR
jgi:hypothetical protein